MAGDRSSGELLVISEVATRMLRSRRKAGSESGATENSQGTGNQSFKSPDKEAPSKTIGEDDESEAVSESVKDHGDTDKAKDARLQHNTARAGTKASSKRPQATDCQKPNKPLTQTIEGKAAQRKPKKPKNLTQSALVATRKRNNIKIRELEQIIIEKDLQLVEKDTKNLEVRERLLIARKDALKLLKRGAIVAQDDDEVREQFASILKMCAKWAKSWSVLSFKGLSEEQLGLLKTKLELGRESWGTQEVFFALIQGKLLPRALAEYVLARYVSRTWTCPFFFLDVDAATAKQFECPENVPAVLEWINSQGKTSSGDKVSMWRALTARTIEPPLTHDSDPLNCERQARLNTLREKKIDSEAAACIAEFTPELLNLASEAEASKRLEELKAIAHKAAILASKLAVQNVDVKVLFLDGLIKKVPHYREDSELMTPHLTMRISEEDESKLIGSRIDLVVHPAIVAYGDEQGENYETYKVWQKAHVYLVDLAKEGNPAASNNGPELGNAHAVKQEDAEEAENDMRSTSTIMKTADRRWRLAQGLKEGSNDRTALKKEGTDVGEQPALDGESFKVESSLQINVDVVAVHRGPNPPLKAPSTVPESGGIAARFEKRSRADGLGIEYEDAGRSSKRLCPP